MTYQEIKQLCQGKHLPTTAKNEDGENVIIEQGCDEMNFFKLTTAQNNGWARINLIYEDGSTDELYQKR